VQTQQVSIPTQVYPGIIPLRRDGIITAFETLWINPDIAKGVLSFFGTQAGKKLNPLQDAEPGKILHEMRNGEMAETGEIPFKLYYGSIDSTPLFIVLAGHYLNEPMIWLP